MGLHSRAAWTYGGRAEGCEGDTLLVQQGQGSSYALSINEVSTPGLKLQYSGHGRYSPDEAGQGKGTGCSQGWTDLVEEADCISELSIAQVGLQEAQEGQ